MPPAGNEDNHQPYSSNEIVVGENEVLPLLSMSTLENGADQIQMKILFYKRQASPICVVKVLLLRPKYPEMVTNQFLRLVALQHS